MMTEKNAKRPATSRILAKDCLLSNNTRETQINNNDLIIGPSGAGKTRGYVKPNLLQCALQGGESLIVADTKGSLIREVGPVMAAHGYRVVNLDLTDLLDNKWGYNPLDYIRYDPVRKRYSAQDINTLAECLLPTETRGDPFWEDSARNYLAALLGYVLEALPKERRNLNQVAKLYQYMDLYEDEKDLKTGTDKLDKLFWKLEDQNPDSFAVWTYRMACGDRRSDKTRSSIKMFLVKHLTPLAYGDLVPLYTRKERIDFRALGREPAAVFLTISDTDRSMDKLANVFYTQALHILLDSADRDYRPDTRLPVPVRLVLDDFATNVVIPEFDKIISVIRSREVYVSLIIQSINQLYALYGEDRGKTIINNCDNLLYLGGQDVDTSSFISIKANKGKDTILNMPLNDAWLFTRGQSPRQVRKYDLEQHPLYPETPEASGLPVLEDPPELSDDWWEFDDGDFDEADYDQPLPELPDMSDAKEIYEQNSLGKVLSFRHRKQIIMEKVKKAELLLSGSRESVCANLVDSEGFFSDKLTWDLTDALTTYAQLFSDLPALDEKDTACLRCFFYCSLLLSCISPGWVPEITGTFRDLRTFAQRMSYPSRTDLHFDELYDRPAMKHSFFGWMDDAYELLSAVPVTSAISAADKQLVHTERRDRIAGLMEMLRLEDADELEEALKEHRNEMQESEMSEWGAKERQRWAREEALREEQQEEWVQDFIEPEQFCLRYLTFRSLYFDTKLPAILPQLVEQALDLYLLDNSVSRFMDDRVFSTACELLDSTAQKLSKLLLRTDGVS